MLYFRTKNTQVLYWKTRSFIMFYNVLSRKKNPRVQNFYILLLNLYRKGIRAPETCPKSKYQNLGGRRPRVLLPVESHHHRWHLDNEWTTKDDKFCKKFEGAPILHSHPQVAGKPPSWFGKQLPRAPRAPSLVENKLGRFLLPLLLPKQMLCRPPAPHALNLIFCFFLGEVNIFISSNPHRRSLDKTIVPTLKSLYCAGCYKYWKKKLDPTMLS